MIRLSSNDIELNYVKSNKFSPVFIYVLGLILHLPMLISVNSEILFAVFCWPISALVSPLLLFLFPEKSVSIQNFLKYELILLVVLLGVFLLYWQYITFFNPKKHGSFGWTDVILIYGAQSFSFFAITFYQADRIDLFSIASLLMFVIHSILSIYPVIYPLILLWLEPSQLSPYFLMMYLYLIYSICVKLFINSRISQAENQPVMAEIQSLRKTRTSLKFKNKRKISHLLPDGIVIDGSNVCWNGISDKESPDPKRLLQLRDYLRLKYNFHRDKIVIYISAALRHQLGSESDKLFLEKLIDKSIIQQSPSNTDDDLVIIETAMNSGYYIITNDQFRDHYSNYPKLKNYLKKYRIPYQISNEKPFFYNKLRDHLN